jgi:hypothetical protein
MSCLSRVQGGGGIQSEGGVGLGLGGMWGNQAKIDEMISINHVGSDFILLAHAMLCHSPILSFCLW